MLVEPGTRGRFRCFGELWYFSSACVSAVRQIMGLIHDALLRIQKYFKIQPLILYSVNLRVLWCNRSISFSQPKRTKPTEDCCSAEIYKRGIKPSDTSITVLPYRQSAPTGPRVNHRNPRGRSWLWLHQLSCESSDIDSPTLLSYREHKLQWACLLWDSGFRADWIKAANNEFAPVKRY